MEFRPKKEGKRNLKRVANIHPEKNFQNANLRQNGDPVIDLVDHGPRRPSLLDSASPNIKRPRSM
jgi:hypothetical protein